jgi:hypothetical protein
MTEKDNRYEKKESTEKKSSPDPETLHKTDPQKHMEGPVSSSMHGLSDAFDTSESKEEADEEKEEKM